MNRRSLSCRLACRPFAVLYRGKGFVIVLNTLLLPMFHYRKAVQAEADRQIPAAMLEYGKAGTYKDAKEKAKSCGREYSQSITGLLAAGCLHTVGLRADGTVVATGNNGSGRCDVDGWTDIVAIAAGWSHTVGLRADGTVVATGDNDYGRCDVDGWTDIVAIAAGGFHTVGLRADGTVVATEYTGDYYHGQCNVDGWTDIVALAAGIRHTVGLRADGTVVATGYNYYGQCAVDGWKNMKLPSAD